MYKPRDPGMIPMMVKALSGHESIKIRIICDWHIGSRESDEKAIDRQIDEIANDPDAYCIICGDLIDNGVKSSVTSCYDAKYQPAEQIRIVVEKLKKIKHKIICMVGGNHEYRTRKDCDISPAQVIAAKLDIEDVYRDEFVYLFLDLGDRINTLHKAPKYGIAVAHGAGGGSKLGAGLNKAEDFALSVDCDLLILGHTHKPSTAPIARYISDNARRVVVPKITKILIATGYLNYVDERGNGGYPARRLMKPVPVAPNYAILNGKEHDVTIIS